MSVAEALRTHLCQPAERDSPLTVALLEGALVDWGAGGITRQVLGPYASESPGSALPLRFTAALHRLVLTGQAPELALYYPTAGGTAAPSRAWPAARRVLTTQTARVRELVALPCQTNEVGRALLLLIGLLAVARRTGSPLRLREIGASAGLNLLVDRFRYGRVYGPAESSCQLPDPGLNVDTDLRIVDRAGCDPAPLDPTTREGRLRLSAGIWGDQLDRFRRLQGALTVADHWRVPVQTASAADWLTHQLRDRPLASPRGPVTVVWHSIVRTYVDPGEWNHTEQLTTQSGVWRLSYEPDPGPQHRGVALRLFGPGLPSDGEILAYGGGHGPPVTLA